jgi:hypothetical protein
MNLDIEDPFLKKFEGRVEKIGEGGIFNCRLRSYVVADNKQYFKDNLINSNKQQKSIISKMRNRYNSLTLDEYNKIPMINIKANKYESEKNINENLKNDKISEENRITIDSINDKNSYSKNNISNYENMKEKINFRNMKSHNNSFPKIFQRNSIINDIKTNKSITKKITENERFYKPYSLKDYKNMMNDYKQEKFGGLGINMNKEWKERQKMYNRVKLFENSVYHNLNKKIKENSFRKIEEPQIAQMNKIRKQIMNSKRFLAQKYGKGVMLNKIREKKRKEKEEINMILRYNDIKNKNIKNNKIVFNNVINIKKEDYNTKLLELKSSLI